MADVIYSEIEQLEYDNGASLKVVLLKNPEPECDIIGIVAASEGEERLVLSMTPSEFSEFTEMCVRALGSAFGLVFDLIGSDYCMNGDELEEDEYE